MSRTQRMSKDSLWQAAPRALLQMRVLANLAYGEPELRLLPGLCDRNATSVDVGSSFGVYAAVMSLHSGETHAFEPNPYLFGTLQKSLGEGISVQKFALSDRAGIAKLRIPIFGGRAVFARASIESENKFGEHRSIDSIEVETRPLDSFSFSKVKLIKIDVEGHEIAVLRGAQETLSRDRPNLIVESESRHHTGCPEAVFDFLAPLGYHGFFLRKGRLTPVAAFQKHRHQSRLIARYGKIPGALYVNNFVFVHGVPGVRRLAALMPLEDGPAGPAADRPRPVCPRG